MKIILPVMAILFTLHSPLLMAIPPSFPVAEENGRIITYGNIPSEVMESVREAVDNFRPALEVEAPGQNQAVEVLKPLDNPEAPQPDCNPREKAYYFFSFSMPEEGKGSRI